MEPTEAREKRRQDFLDWDVEHLLPETIGNYRFHRIDKQVDRIYYAFGYIDEDSGWEVRVLFDEETMDFMVKTDIHLFTMTNIDLITGNFDVFKEKLPLLLEKDLRRELIDRPVSVIVAGRGFTTWDFEKVLPETIGGYRRMVTPDRPILGLNGSYIIAMYENQKARRGMLFFYNMFRNEYYAEKYADGNPIIMHDYDAKTIADFSKIIEKGLADELGNENA